MRDGTRAHLMAVPRVAMMLEMMTDAKMAVMMVVLMAE